MGKRHMRRRSGRVRNIFPFCLGVRDIGDVMANPVLPTLYRTLLRMARQLDAAPMSKALLIAQPELLFDRRSRELVRLPELSGSAGHELARRLTEFNRGEFYAPETSARAAVRSARDGMRDVDPVDAGLKAIRTLSLAVAGGGSLESKHAFDCGSPSAVERVVTVRRSDTVRAGSLLLTHPVSCIKQPSLHHAVILLVSVDSDAVTGVVINKPLGLSLGATVPDELRAALGPTLGDAPLHKGGDVSERQLLLLHQCEGLRHSTLISDGLFCTSDFVEVREAFEAVRASTAAGGDKDARDGGAAPTAPPRIKCVAGYAGWAREQLHAELQRNVWFLCEADDVAALAMMTEPITVPPDALRDSMWSGALRQLGGEYEHLARFPGNHEIVWQYMEQLWIQQSDELHRRIDALGTARGGTGRQGNSGTLGGGGDRGDRGDPELPRDPG